jgi:hypothetical protein
VIAEESRSQHENRAKGLARLRRALFLELRDPPPEAGFAAHPDLAPAVRDGRLDVGRKDPRFWPAAGVALDALAACEARVAEAAAALGVGTANLVEFLGADPKLWQQANQWRARAGQKPLRS